MNYKKCPYCTSQHCKKDGFQNNIQRWKCLDCTTRFQANKKDPPLKEGLFCLYAFNKQTLDELAQVYHIRSKDTQKMFDTIALPDKVHTSRSIALCIDAKYFGTLCVIVFRDQKLKENLWWCFCSEERLCYYAEGKRVLEQLGYSILSVTADGFPGIPQLYKGIPYQYCHFHAKKTITTYLTKRPKTPAGVALVEIMDCLQYYTQEQFLARLDQWLIQYQSFIDEKTYHSSTHWSYTHRKLRSALRSMKRMSQYLFTYLNTTSISIPRTTNTVEGHWKNVEVRVNCHAGLSISRKMKLISLILLNSTVSYKVGMEKKLFRLE